MNVPADLLYTPSHEWASPEGKRVRVGITDFAQSQLADLTFVDLPKVGDIVSAGDEVAVVESVKAASDVYSPISGKVIEINEALSSSPEAINQDPFGEGWLFVVEPSDDSELGTLLDAAAYRDLLPDA
jgi:glycine cleavage system H protein